MCARGGGGNAGPSGGAAAEAEEVEVENLVASQHLFALAPGKLNFFPSVSIYRNSICRGRPDPHPPLQFLPLQIIFKILPKILLVQLKQ